MTQRQISHPDPIPACGHGHPARLIHDQRRYAARGGFYVECRCCATRKTLTADAAAQDWRRLHLFRRPSVKQKGGAAQPDMFASGREQTAVDARQAAALDC